MSKNQIFFLSDVHIGTNLPTNWYQKSVHEPYLEAAFEYIIDNAGSTQELVLLGDFVDFWTYPANTKPPEMADIIAANPNILGSNGLLSQTLSALKGNVSFVNGNHDMSVTQQDLNQIRNPDGYTIRQVSPQPVKDNLENLIYYPLGDDKSVVCTHGHIYSFFNAPYTASQNTLAPLPLGYFVTRCAASYFQGKLKPGETVVDLPDGESPSGWNFTIDALEGFLEDLHKGLFPAAVIGAIAKATGVSMTQPFTLSDGSTINFEEIEKQKLYNDFMNQWLYFNLFIPQKYQHGKKYARYSLSDRLKLLADALIKNDGEDNLDSFAPVLSRNSDRNQNLVAKACVMGHTHLPRQLELSPGYNYANSGFNCPVKPDIASGQANPTFAAVNTQSYTTSVYEVVKDGSSYKVQPWSG